LATITSGTVLIPTTSAPKRHKYLYSVGGSNPFGVTNKNHKPSVLLGVYLFLKYLV
jgi:hypothetical protein